MEQIFTNVYENKIWGNNESVNYSGSSGDGSSINYNINNYVPFIRQFIVINNIKTVIDLGCGDFICGKSIYDDLNVLYSGYDTYNKLIEYNSSQYPKSKYTFTHLDFFTYKETIVNGDLCILKDVIQHWSLENIYSFLDYLIANKKFKFIILCNCCHQNKDNTDIQNGDFRPLSCDYFPLKKYSPKKLYYYNTKEISVIEIT